jgi:26S proteasome regulatory subunit N11
MLINLHKIQWSEGLENEDWNDHNNENEETLKELANLALLYHKWVQDEITKPKEELVVSTVGKVNPKNRLSEKIEDAMTSNITECLGTMMNTEIF